MGDARDLPTGWSELPPDLVRRCASHLPCDEDRVGMKLQCRAWRDAMRGMPRSLQLPWMLVPLRRTAIVRAGEIRRATFFCFLSARPHKKPVPPFAFASRYIGSYDGGWVMLATGQNCGYRVTNFHTGQHFSMPEHVFFNTGSLAKPVVIRAATLSCTPDNQNSCVVACIVSTFERPFMSRTLICFARLGATVYSCPMEMDFQDVLFFGGSFYCLTRIEDILRCTPQFDPSSAPTHIRFQNAYLEFESQRHGGGYVPFSALPG